MTILYQKEKKVFFFQQHLLFWLKSRGRDVNNQQMSTQRAGNFSCKGGGGPILENPEVSYNQLSPDLIPNYCDLYFKHHGVHTRYNIILIKSGLYSLIQLWGQGIFSKIHFSKFILEGSKRQFGTSLFCLILTKLSFSSFKNYF